MNVTVKLRLTTPMLGDQYPGRDGVRHFRKQGNCLIVDRDAWMEKLTHSVGRLGYHVDPATVVVPEHILMASSHIYRKEFSRVKVENFESFRKGTILCLGLETKDRPKAPNLHQLHHMFSYVGVHLGISPWGSKFGFGRFDIVEIN